MDKLYKYINYTIPVSYLTNVFIYEYDISKANISILYTYNIISKEVYDELYIAPRMVRQKYVGYLQKDIKIVKILQQGIIEAKQLLFESNNMQDNEVLSIKNDAVFVINRQLNSTKFNNIEFKLKNTYTGFYKIDNLELYYYFNSITSEENLHVKGINDVNLLNHEPYFLQFLKDLFNIIQVSSIENALKVLKAFTRQYIDRSLNMGFYRQFNASSSFHIINNSSGYMLKNMYDNIDLIDISTNLHILIELQKILLQMYFNKY